MSWEGWAAIVALAALAIDIVRRLVCNAQEKGLNMAKDAQQTKDIDGIGKKVAQVRAELKEEISTVRNEHDALREKVNEIAITVSSSYTLLTTVVSSLDRLIVAHHKGPEDAH